jgi:hypothetical protein
MLNIDNSFSQQAMLTKTCGITNNRPPPSNHPPGINYEVLWSGACTESCIQFVSEYYVNKYKAVKSTKVRAGTVPAQQVSPAASSACARQKMHARACQPILVGFLFFAATPQKTETPR